jgi:hypothetical protein
MTVDGKDWPKMNNEATKHDQEKPRMDLIPAEAMLEVARVMEFGARKYADHNWRKGTKWGRYIGAALRHTFAWMTGESNDPETGLNHLAHAICCLMFVLTYEKTKVGEDDRAGIPAEREKNDAGICCGNCFYWKRNIWGKCSESGNISQAWMGIHCPDWKREK